MCGGHAAAVATSGFAPGRYPVHLNRSLLMTPVHRPVLIFDTSAINKLADDPHSSSLGAGIRSAFFTRFTETNISEIVATANESRRDHLLNSVQSLMSHAHCVHPYQWIIDQQAAMFDKSPLHFDWRKLNIRFLGCEDEIVRRN